MAANSPITMKVALKLGSVEINPQFITFTHVTPSNSVVMIDMNMPMQPLRLPITADSALMRNC
ncbi:unnamed protein product [Trifolium pratense]|uniref:Uncharacterized protein n=1 Tax=Trifolium pratense TaxID=57577 RepID=A0ACB0IBC1_TRIPR|nr:unnamed protein product [Trifolium pratense]